ncbi:hypothetical protein AVEN_266428-1 [Araneus ventricosus]|uniref:Uncharacterized protein n=1 Tax=Araneus ventricosus TaxID=182803 RepID=A0A4Y2TJX4_ARAVE|nr:hypothetical protein AVEN_266428-1 [Araneus ventricosus]
MSMILLFFAGYQIAFETFELPMYLLFTHAACALSHLLLIMVPASITNEAAKTVKRIVRSLPYEMPNSDKELKFGIQKCLFQWKFLSLWNIYVLDRSLIFTAIGTLFTYGILLGSLGKAL